MSKLTEAYERGLAAGKTFGRNLAIQIADSVDFMRSSYPLTAGLDLAEEVYKLDCQRLEAVPDATRFPETRGIADIVRTERQAFREGSGATDAEIAYYYSWTFYYSRRVNTRYIGIAPARNECSAAYLPDSAEGGPLYGRNWDVLPNAWAKSYIEPPREGADGKKRMFVKGVSCSVFLDEEPEELFPVDPFALMPEDCKKVADGVEFLSRYRDFWGPMNCIMVDEDHDSVAIEKANCRMGVRKADSNGASAVGAVSFMVPEMREYKRERGLASIAKRGWTVDEAPDWKYWQGADLRYERLLKLAGQLDPRTARLEDMARVMTDHAVPYPARVCLAGEGELGAGPHEREWTLCSHSEVLEGPNRRIHFFTSEDGKPCYETPPYLVPGVGVEVKPEWKAGTRPLPPMAKNPRPRIHAEYPAVRMML
jgi:hypothetical protein